jgi:hypothetical protein
MASRSEVSIMRRRVRAWTIVSHCLPDDRLFVALLTTWVALLVVATYLLLGWESAGVLITVAGAAGIATVAFQSRQHDRQNHEGVLDSVARNR